MIESSNEYHSNEQKNLMKRWEKQALINALHKFVKLPKSFATGHKREYAVDACLRFNAGVLMHGDV